MGLQVGAGRVDTTPVTPCELAGYGLRRELPLQEDVHDPISLRALYARGTSGDSVLITADIIGFSNEWADRVRGRLEVELGVSPGNVVLYGSHTHSAPTLGGERLNVEWLRRLEDLAILAAALAKTRLDDAVLKVGRGTCAIGINRRELTPDGGIMLGQNPEGAIDRELIVVAADRPDGTPVARIFNFGCHGVVMGPRNLQLSGDWPGLAAIKLEEELGAPVMFINGGPGNVNPVVATQNEFEPAEKLADEFCTSFRKASEKLESLPDDDQTYGKAVTLNLQRKLRDVENGMGRTKPQPLRGLRVGAMRVVGYPGEVFAQTTMAVKKESPHAVTMVGSYADGRGGGYLPVADAFDTGGHEVRFSGFGEGAEAMVRKGLLELLSDL